MYAHINTYVSHMLTCFSWMGRGRGRPSALSQSFCLFRNVTVPFSELKIWNTHTNTCVCVCVCVWN